MPRRCAWPGRSPRLCSSRAGSPRGSGERFGWTHEPAGEVELVEVDGRPAEPPRLEPLTPSDLLSDQLELFGRDRIFEEAVRSFSSQPT